MSGWDLRRRLRIRTTIASTHAKGESGRQLSIHAVLRIATPVRVTAEYNGELLCEQRLSRHQLKSTVNSWRYRRRRGG